MSFQQISIEAATDFLQTVVVLDDKAGFDSQNVDKFDKVPDRKSLAEVEDSSEDGTTNRNYSRHSLDAESLIEGFAKRGIVCSVLKPKKTEEQNETETEDIFYKIACNTDIVILDWVMDDFEKEEGQFALKLIKNLSSTKDESEYRLRHIVIYTANEDITKIISEIKDILDTTKIEVLNGFVFKYESTLISIFSKGGYIEVQGEGDRVEREVEAMELPEKIVKDFSLLTQGLLSNVALKSFAAIRKNTHRALARFKPYLDPAFLTHRILLSTPELSNEHLIPLILSELQAIICDSEVQKIIDKDCLQKWLEFSINQGLDVKRKLKSLSISLAKQGMLELLFKGFRSKKFNKCSKHYERILGIIKDGDSNKDLNEITRLLVMGDTQDTDGLNNQFAMLMSLRNRYKAPPPKLMLGTVIAQDIRDEESQYWICVQPFCDCVRIKGERNFLFIKTEVRREGQKKYSFIVSDNGEYKRLREILRPFESKFISFKVEKGKNVIEAKERDDGWVFYSDPDDNSNQYFRWIADLKQEFAQRLAHGFGRNLSRVGLTESELLRRIGK